MPRTTLRNCVYIFSFYGKFPFAHLFSAFGIIKCNNRGLPMSHSRLNNPRLHKDYDVCYLLMMLNGECEFTLQVLRTPKEHNAFTNYTIIKEFPHQRFIMERLHGLPPASQQRSSAVNGEKMYAYTLSHKHARVHDYTAFVSFATIRDDKSFYFQIIFPVTGFPEIRKRLSLILHELRFHSTLS